MTYAFNDVELARKAGRKSSGMQIHRLAVKRCGIAACRPGSIPGWWWNLAIKPDPRVLFECEDWPVGRALDPQWHLSNQELIHGRYRYRPWYPAFARGISWYQLCRERESQSTLAKR